METNKILQADILDIIFEGRNKQYGAYELRKTYNRRIIIAISLMAMICLLGFLSGIFASHHGNDKNMIFVKDVQLDNLAKQPSKVQPPPPPPKKVTPQIKTIQSTPPLIVEDKLADNPPPTQDDLVDSKIGTQNHDGKIDDGSFAPPVEEKGTGIVAAPSTHENDIDERFTKVEKEAMFPGGPNAWHKYLERNLNASAAQEDGAPVGSYSVKVQFVVNTEGAISNVTAIESPRACPSCAKEAVKIIQKGPRWEPAIQNGRKVTYQAIQFITFQVAEE